MSSAKYFALLAVLTFGLRLPSFLRPLMDLDEGAYAAIACRMLEGGLLYRDGADNKPPAIYYLYEAVFRAFGRYDMVAIHVVVAIAALCTALACGAVARRIAGPRAGRLAGLSYATFSTFYSPKMLAANTEMFLVLPATLAVLLHLRAEKRRSLYVVAGALAGIALAFKQMAAPIVVVLIGERLLHSRRDRSSMARRLGDGARVALGFLAVVVAVGVHLNGQGTLEDAIYWSWTYPWVHYIPAGTRRGDFPLRFAATFLPFTLCMSPLWFWAARARKPRIALIWLWLGGMAAAALIGERLYGHSFLLMVPPLSVLGGVGADRWLEEPSVRRGPILALISVAALGFALAAYAIDQSTGTFWRARPSSAPVTDFVERNTQPDEPLFVWGSFTALYVESNRCPATRFVYMHLLTGADAAHPTWHTVPEAWPMLLEDLNAAPPRYVLDTSPGGYGYTSFPPESYPPLWSFLQEKYEVDRTIEGVRIFRRTR